MPWWLSHDETSAMNCFSVVLLSLSWLLLAGCMPDLKSERPPERIYWLESATVEDPPVLDLSVDVVPGLNSDRIWLLEPDQRLNFYAGVYWPDHLQPLLESLISRSLPASDDGLQMGILIERFFAVAEGEGNPPRIELVAELSSAASSCKVALSQRSASSRLRDIVAGHQTLVDELIVAIAAFGRSGRCP
jgi:hypothetical protein